MNRHQALAEFLKTKRAQLAPERAGLPVTTRRRTPGLRREEVARMAAVGLTWYTWLEQGRKITVSPQVLRGVARALQLTPAEERHLFELAQVRLPEGAEPLRTEVSPTMQAIVKGFSLPAILINQAWDVLAWNPAAQKLSGTFDGKTDAERNMLRIMFADAESRRRILNWERQAKNSIGLFRSMNAKAIEAQWYRQLIADLSADSSEFRDWWPRHEVYQTMETAKQYKHPDPTIGIITVLPVFMKTQEYPNLDLLVYVPADALSEQKMTALTELA